MLEHCLLSPLCQFCHKPDRGTLPSYVKEVSNQTEVRLCQIIQRTASRHCWKTTAGDWFSHAGHNRYALLSLALVNSMYVYSMTTQSYRFQQLGLYLYTANGSQVIQEIGVRFNTWDEWRRTQFHTLRQPGSRRRRARSSTCLRQLFQLWFHLRSLRNSYVCVRQRPRMGITRWP